MSKRSLNRCNKRSYLTAFNCDDVYAQEESTYLNDNDLNDKDTFLQLFSSAPTTDVSCYDHTEMSSICSDAEGSSHTSFLNNNSRDDDQESDSSFDEAINSHVETSWDEDLAIFFQMFNMCKRHGIDVSSSMYLLKKKMPG